MNQFWENLYIELGNKLSQIESITWIDLWHNQVGFLDDEHPFPTPAAFLSFRTVGTEDAGQKIQKVRLQVDVYLFFETFADTYKGGVNQSDALEFLNILNEIHVALHGTSGDYYSEMRRLGFSPVDTGSAGNLYRTVFECELLDNSAANKYVENADDLEVETERGDIEEEESENEYNLDF